MNNPLVRGNAYDHSTVEIFIDGIPVLGCRAIDYSMTRESTQNYGIGPYSFNRGFAKISFEGSIELYMDELEALRIASPTGLLPDIDPFSIVVTFTPKGKTPAVHVLENVIFTNDAVSSSVDDTSVSTVLNLDIGRIKLAQ